jgi:hypothetical protein
MPKEFHHHRNGSDLKDVLSPSIAKEPSCGRDEGQSQVVGGAVELRERIGIALRGQPRHDHHQQCTLSYRI